MPVSIAFHIVGLTLWVGGLIILPRLLVLLSKSGSDLKPTLPAFKRVFYGFVVAGFGVALITGLYQVGERGVGVLMAQGWFHTKLTAVVVLVVLTVLLGAELRKIGQGGVANCGKLMAIHGISALFLVGIPLLTLIGR